MRNALMRTTLEIPDALFGAAKHKAVSEGVPLKTAGERAAKGSGGKDYDVGGQKKTGPIAFCGAGQSTK